MRVFGLEWRSLLESEESRQQWPDYERPFIKKWKEIMGLAQGSSPESPLFSLCATGGDSSELERAAPGDRNPGKGGPRPKKEPKPSQWHLLQLRLPPPGSFQLFLDNKAVAGILGGSTEQKSPGLAQSLRLTFQLLEQAVRRERRPFAGREWATWITRWQNKAADEAANIAMDLRESFLWAADCPATPAEVLLVYADGGCRTRDKQGRGPAASASVMLAWRPGFRAARLLQVRALYWQELTAAEAEVGAAALAAWAVNSASVEQELRRPGCALRHLDLQIDPILSQLRDEYFHQGVEVVGKLIAQ